MTLQHDLAVLLPELILAVAGMLLLLLGVAGKNDRAMGNLSALAVAAMIVAGLI